MRRAAETVQMSLLAIAIGGILAVLAALVVGSAVVDLVSAGARRSLR